ncbi:MAG: molybdopterin cofactor-binding domain-containing protein [Steroidobacteraceae bacterium]
MSSLRPTVVDHLSRRTFLVRTALASCGVAFATACGQRGSGPADAPDRHGPPLAANAWVTLYPDGRIDIVSPGIELGQGSMSTLPRFLAEELDADWDMVRCVPAPVDEARFGNPLFWGIQITAGSRTCMGYADVLRIAGAQARHVLLLAAARRWNVPPDDLRTGTGYVVHPDGHTRLAYRDLVPVAQVPRSFPDFVDREHRPHLTDEFYGEAPLSPLRPDPQKPGAVPLKTHRTFRLLGVDAPRVDIPAKVDGSARFGIDTVLPDLTYAMVETGPVAGCAPVAVKDGDARAVPGVIDVLRLPHGVAVIGSTISALQKARTRLSIQWSSNPAAESFESRDTLDRYLRIARDTAPQRGVRVLEIGDTAAARAALGGDGTVSFDVRSEFVYHATMEPQNATLRVAADGRSAEAWVSTQWPGAERDAVARILEIKPEAVTIHTPFVGGAFGRRQEPGAIIDAAYIAHQLRRPVKVLWTREDDLKRNPFRQALACHVRAAVSPDGAILAMHHRVVADSWFARMFPDLFEQYSDTDPGNWTGALHAYDVPLQTVDCVTERGPIDVCYLRGIGVAQVKFAQESLIDRIARGLGKDVIEYRRGLLRNSPRGLAVLDATAAMSDWHRSRPGERALGFAYVPYGNSHAALATEISLNRSSGEVRVHRVWCAVDVGFAVQPAIVASQVEGGILQGLSIALFEQVTVRRGVVQQTNFHDYRMLRMSECPDVEIKVLSTDNPVTGVCETGVMPIAPAINSAIAALTGVHLNRLPMSPETILAALPVIPDPSRSLG